MSKSRPLRLGTAVYLLLGILPSLLSQTPLRVGYAVLSADQEGGAPVASALFSSTNAAGILVWEAGVLAVEPLSSGRIFVDQQEGTRTAIAMVNPLDEMVSVTLILRDAAGKESDRMDQDFGPRQHRSLFADELFSGLSDFSGSLTFQTTDSSHQLAAGTLRENTNLSGEAIFATLPVVDLQAPAGTDPLILPQVGAGQGLSTLIILINASQERVTGTIKLIDGEGAPLEMELDGTTGTEFGYDLEAHGTFRGEITHLEGTAVGYAVVELEEGIRTPSGSAIFQFRAGEAVVSEAGVAGIQPTSQARIFVDQEDTRTGVAIANFQNPETLVTFELLEVSGDTRQTKTETLPAGGHLSVFVDELFSELEEGFKGLMEVRAVEAIAPVTLKLTRTLGRRTS